MYSIKLFSRWQNNLEYPLLLEHMPVPNILAYSVETVIAEKMHAIVDLADQSSRMKDYYDLYNILSKEKYDVDTLQEAIMRTFEKRCMKHVYASPSFTVHFTHYFLLQIVFAGFQAPVSLQRLL